MKTNMFLSQVSTSILFYPFTESGVLKKVF